MFNLLKLNLQFFSADDAGGGVDPVDPVDPVVPPADPNDPPAKTFTQEDVDELIKNRVARIEKDKQKAIDEAKKLAGLNEAEKQKYEFEKLQKENEELRNEKNKYSLGREAAKMLTALNIAADDDVLDFVVKGDAEATKQAVQAFGALVHSKVDDAVRDKLKGTSPKAPANIPSGVTKEQLNKMGYLERLGYSKKNPDAYNQLTKGE